MKQNTIKVLTTVGIIAASLATGAAAMAYFSGTAAPVNNEYHIVAGSKGDTTGNVGTITEPSWKEFAQAGQTPALDENGDGVDDRKQMAPGQEFDKDPYLESNAEYNSVGYILVSVPTISAKKDGDADAKVYDTVTLGTTGTGWTLCYSSVSTTAGTDSKYLYRYDTELQKTDGATGGKDKTATSAFSKITVQDFTDIQASQSGLTDAIVVSGAIIQSEGNCTVDSTGAITGAAADGKADSIAKALLGLNSPSPV